MIVEVFWGFLRGVGGGGEERTAEADSSDCGGFYFGGKRDVGFVGIGNFKIFMIQYDIDISLMI